MATTQDIYTESSERCQKCGEYLHGRGSKLPAKDGRQRYLCAACTEIKCALEALISSPGGIDWAERHVEMIAEMEQHPLIASAETDGYYKRMQDDLYKTRVSLQVLIREAGEEQPWD